MTACNLTSQKVVLSINSYSLCLSLSHLLQLLHNLYGLGWFIHDHIVYSLFVCVHVCMSVRVCALGRPLECDSRPAQWQETPWRLWQAASCTPSFAFLSLTHFSSLCYLSFSTYNSSSPLLHLYSLHSYPTCLFVFLFHSSAPCFLGSSQWDLNNWTFLILYFFAYFFFCLNQWMGLSISSCAYSLILFLFSHLHSVFCLLAVTSVAPRLTHLVYITWHSRRWSLNPISSLLLSSAHPTIQWPLEPQRDGIIPVRGEQSSALLGCTDLTCTHSYGHPYLYTTQGIIQVHC